VAATCVRLVIGALLGVIVGSSTPIIAESRPARQPLNLMPMGRRLRRPPAATAMNLQNPVTTYFGLQERRA